MSIANPVVLVVEGGWVLRLVAVELVEDAGFQALSAANADEALSILETRGDVWLLFTDVQMPGSMDGLSLAHPVRDRWPPAEPTPCPTVDGLLPNPMTARRCRRHFRRWRRWVRADQHAPGRALGRCAVR